jgi:hypothetical protein
MKFLAGYLGRLYMGLRDIKLSDLIDWIYPSLEKKKGQPESDDERAHETVESRVNNLSSGEEALEKYLESAEKLIEKEQSRRASVDARLMSIFSLTSIAATVVLTALFFNGYRDNAAAARYPKGDVSIRVLFTSPCNFIVRLTPPLKVCHVHHTAVRLRLIFCHQMPRSLTISCASVLLINSFCSNSIRM